MNSKLFSLIALAASLSFVTQTGVMAETANSSVRSTSSSVTNLFDSPSFVAQQNALSTAQTQRALLNANGSLPVFGLYGANANYGTGFDRNYGSYGAYGLGSNAVTGSNGIAGNGYPMNPMTTGAYAPALNSFSPAGSIMNNRALGNSSSYPGMLIAPPGPAGVMFIEGY